MDTRQETRSARTIAFVTGAIRYCQRLKPSKLPTPASFFSSGKVLAVALAILFILPSYKVVALTLSQSPLYLSNTAKSNIILSIDDSGSMDSEVLFETNDGALWWHTSDQSFTGRDKNDAVSAGTINFNKVGTADSTWKKYVYLFPNGTGTGNRVYSDSTNDHYAIPPLSQYAWTRSPTYNKAYFDPSVTYAPWVSYTGSTYVNMTATNASSDPARGGTSLDLTSDIQSDSANRTFKMHAGTTIPAGTYYKDWTDNTWKTAASAVSITTTRDVPIRYFPATVYVPQGTTPSAFSSYTATKLSGTAPNGSALDGYEIKPGNFSDATQYSAAIQNFANWFSYARKRHMAMRGGVGHAFAGMSNIRTGLFRINNRVTVNMLDFDTQSDTFYSTLYGFVGSGGTPNRQALNHAGQQFMRTDASAPITQKCQQNFAIAFTDGYSTVDTSSGVGNADGASGTYSGTNPYKDDYSNTIADIAMYYYKTNLRPDLPSGHVPTTADDTNQNLHMVTFAVTLGVKGHIYGVTHNSIAAAFSSTPVWQNPTTARDPMQVDDLYHAAINGRGDLLNATTPSDIQTKMEEALGTIGNRTGSSSAVAANSVALNTSSAVYQARFISGEWTGDLQIREINTDGTVSAGLIASAKSVLAAQNWDTGRAILARNDSQGIPFRWITSGANALTAALMSNLNTNPATSAADGQGEARLWWLRGNASNEGSTSTSFRERNGYKLGDIVNSDPIFVGGPPYMPETETALHSTFRSAYINRRKMVYVGANDGMLHGFDAATAQEKIAYVPSMVFENLNKLTDTSYDHRYYVDGSPASGDAYDTFAYGCASVACWRTLVVSGLAAGGKGLFALDVTDPDGNADTTTYGLPSTSGLAFIEGNAANIALWEWDGTAANASAKGYNTRDLGYIYGKPTITRMQDGEWAVVFGNGYNSDSQRAVLYIVRARDGVVIKSIDFSQADSTGNGLSTPIVADVDGDNKADYIYAGDLLGNLWKADIDQSSTSTWKTAYGTSGSPDPLFVAADASNVLQPITSRPVVGRHPDGQSGYMVYFGTGRYFVSGDQTPSPTPVNTFYGIWDKNDNSGSTPVERADLLPQTISVTTITTTDDTYNVRTVTNTAMQWRTGVSGTCQSNGTGTCLGWRVDLRTAYTDALGEMMVTNPILTGTDVLPAVSFTTLIPQSDACSAGGTSFYMLLNPQNGGPLSQAVIDINKDGVIDGNDKANGSVVAGFDPNMGILSDPITLYGRGGLSSTPLSGSEGDIDSIRSYFPYGTLGRQSWRQLK